jgi:hypothetical protein
VDTDGSALIFVGWIRIHMPPDQGGQKIPINIEKSEKFSSFEKVLDVLFCGLKANLNPK